MRHIARLPLVVALLVSLSLVSRPGQAQSGREALVLGTRAYDLADFDGAISLLSRGLNPSATPRDKLWLEGVQKLADALLQRDQVNLAETWLRWALRLEPGMAPDSVNFPPTVWLAFDHARSSVAAALQDTLVAHLSWQWSSTPVAMTGGSLVVRSTGVGITARIESGGPLSPGVPQPLAPESYTIVATAEGYEPARIVAEVLPGVATQVWVRLKEIPPGLLYAASRPWGTVYVDNARIGYSAVAAHSVSAGTHRVRIERVGYAPFDTTVFVTQNRVVRLGPIGSPPAQSLGAQVGGVASQVNQALTLLDSAQTERAVGSLRALLGAWPPGGSVEQRVRANMYLGAASLSLGLRDSAAARFQEAVRLNAFAVPEPEAFNPDVQAAFREARRSTPSVHLRVAADTVIRPLAEGYLVAVAVGRPGSVNVRLVRSDGATAGSAYLPLNVDSTRSGVIPLRLSDSLPLEPGDYRLTAEMPGTATQPVAIALRIARPPVDTATLEPPLDSTLFKPETRKGPPVPASALLGAAFGAAAAAAPMVLGNKDLDGGKLQAPAISVGLGIAAAGVAGVVLGRRMLPIQENIQYNRSLVTAWQQRNRGIARANEEKRRSAPLRVTVMEERP